jgi:hypothetical protein
MIAEPETLIQVAPAPNAGAIETLETILRNHTCWITAAGLLSLMGIVESDSAKRQIRELASASHWIISGQLGYKHLEHATAEEIDHAANWLESQAKKMSDRACAIRRNAHKLFAKRKAA